MSPVGPLIAFFLTTALIGVLRPLAIAIGLLDIPSRRKNHSGNIPLVGGMSIFIAALLATQGYRFLDFGGDISSASLTAFFTAGFILIVVGAWDDYRDLQPVVRFAAQITAVLIMIYGGEVVLSDLGRLTPAGELLTLGWLGVPFTVFACLGVINAMNMCDGLDGLSGVLTLIALLGLGAVNSLWGGIGYQYMIAVFSACVVGFLFFNLRTFWRSKACVFLGDAGSMLLGFTLAWLLVSLSQGEVRVISPSAALWFLMVPLYDAVSMMLRRVFRRRSPFKADREHLHHVFLLAGFSVAETVAFMCGIAVVGVGVGLAGTWFGVSDIWLAGGFLVGGLLYYWAVCRAWRVMRFLKRSICRRRGEERRERELLLDDTYTGLERRTDADRRNVS